MGCVCVYQPFTDFSDESLNAWRPLSPSNSCGKEFTEPIGFWRIILGCALKLLTHWFPSCACTERSAENCLLFPIVPALRGCLPLSKVTFFAARRTVLFISCREAAPFLWPLLTSCSEHFPVLIQLFWDTVELSTSVLQGMTVNCTKITTIIEHH